MPNCPNQKILPVYIYVRCYQTKHLPIFQHRIKMSYRARLLTTDQCSQTHGTDIITVFICSPDHFQYPNIDFAFLVSWNGTSNIHSGDDQFSDPAIVSGCLSGERSASPPGPQPHWMKSIQQLTEVNSASVNPHLTQPQQHQAPNNFRQPATHSRMPFAQNMHINQTSKPLICRLLYYLNTTMVVCYWFRLLLCNISIYGMFSSRKRHWMASTICPQSTTRLPVLI